MIHDSHFYLIMANYQTLIMHLQATFVLWVLDFDFSITHNTIPVIQPFPPFINYNISIQSVNV